MRRPQATGLPHSIQYFHAASSAHTHLIGESQKKSVFHHAHHVIQLAIERSGR